MTADSKDSTSVVDVLRRIEARHADKSRWCQGATARGKNGRQVKLTGKAVVSTCLVGAMDLEAYWEGARVRMRVRELLHEARNACGYSSRALSSVNDDLGYEAVRKIERRAIELAEADGPQ